MARLELRHLVKRYGAFYAVNDVSVDVADNELICLLGPSGCGKTTTLRIIGGFITPDGGDVAIDGQSILRLPPERRPTAMVFQRYALWPHMDVWHNVAFGLQLRRQPRAKIDQAVQQSLALVGMPGFAKRYPAQLSGGQQQRVALARALVLEPRLLLLDEPLSNLDAKLRAQMRAEIKDLQRRVGITTVFVTHDQEEALSIADRIGVMKDGVLEQIDTPSALYARPATLFVANFIGTMNLLDGRAAGSQVAAGPFTLPPPDGARLADGRAVTVGVRPEDFALAGPGGPGAPARVTQITDLGHYHRATVEFPDHAPLTVFTTKAQEIPFGEATIWPARALYYVDERLAGTLEREPAGEAAGRERVGGA
ncbi:MAG TPA: ABC transporter ATP-binding protein [Thermomicrobiales bacterium]|nr:ABC transporter ATP-binding protein [Thermomicrobiales bacterium]